MSSNNNLKRAKRVKNDEFYTTLEDIEKELRNYDFSGMTVYSPCDDYRESNFKKYFTDNFQTLGLKKYICTNIDNGNGAWRYEYDGKSEVITQLSDGDFNVQNETFDVICTNPPFSKLRQFVSWCKGYFLIIIPKSSLAYNEIFPLIQNEQAWIGNTSPDEFIGQKSDMGGLTFWLTNLGLPTSTPLPLSKSIKDGYSKYDEYDAIEVGRVKDIPYDYTGDMGVPITFLLGNHTGYKIKGILKGEFSKPNGIILGHRPTISGKPLYTRVIISKL